MYNVSNERAIFFFHALCIKLKKATIWVVDSSHLGRQSPHAVLLLGSDDGIFWLSALKKRWVWPFRYFSFLFFSVKVLSLDIRPPFHEEMETIRIVTNGVLCTLGLWGHTTLTVAVQLLSIFIWPFSKKLYYAFHAHIMRQWAQNLFEIMRLFAPGELIITFDDSITNDMDDDNNNEALEELLTRNMKGQVTGISFPEKLIMISNHQVKP